MILTENKLRNIIRESIINIINEDINSNSLNKYHIFYIDNGNVYSWGMGESYVLGNKRDSNENPQHCGRKCSRW